MNPEKTLLQNKEAEPRYSLVSEHVPGIYKARSKSSVLKRTTTTTTKDEQKVKTDKWEREGSIWREPRLRGERIPPTNLSSVST